MSRPMGKIPLDRLRHQMVVIRHQAAGVIDPVVTLRHFRQNIQEPPAILVVLVDRLAPVAPGGKYVSIK
jgi:hypothetical protein